MPTVYEVLKKLELAPKIKMIEISAPERTRARIGPPLMMRATANVTKAHSIKTIVSLNPIMIDGMGICGGCRVTIDGQPKFACLDGPEFDGHLVNFDELIQRLRMYLSEEERAAELHECKMGGTKNV